LSARLESDMSFHRARVAWLSWSLTWAAIWAVAAAFSVPRHLCGAVLVHTSNGQQCIGTTATGSLGLMIVCTVLGLASVAVGFISVSPGKIRRHLAARRPARMNDG
jgi:hypothetical protein